MLINLDNYFLLKPGSTAPTNIYLGGKVPKVFFTNVVEAYKLSSSKYVQKYAKNVEYNIEKKLMNLYMRSSTPLLPSSRPEMDAPPALILSDNIYFQLLIGVIIWAVKLGRIDITCGV